MIGRTAMALLVATIPCRAIAETDGVLLRCTLDQVEAHGGYFTQGVRFLEDPEVRFTLTVKPDSLVFRSHMAGATTPGRGVHYQSAMQLEDGILYRQREADAQSEYASGHEFHRNEVSVPFSLDSFTSFEMVWMCYDLGGCTVHTQRIEATCDSAIAIEGDVY